jgi:hypothetical protein
MSQGEPKEPESVKTWLGRYNGAWQFPMTGAATFSRNDDEVLLIAEVPTTANNGRGRKINSQGKEASEEVRIVLYVARSGICATISGCLGGYNRSAPSVVELLRQAKKISEKNAQAWFDWYDAIDKAQAVKAEIDNLESLAEKHGFLLKKKPAKKTKPNA